MARYLMGDTRLAGWERMMTDPSRFPRAKLQKKEHQKKPAGSGKRKPRPVYWEGGV